MTRINLLTILWFKVDEALRLEQRDLVIPASDFFDVKPCTEIPQEHLEYLQKFLDTASAGYQIILEEVGASYLILDAEKTQRHIIFKFLLNNTSTFYRFFINTYFQAYEEGAVSSDVIWNMVLSWGREYRVPVTQLPHQNQIMKVLIELGYQPCELPQRKRGVWGIVPSG